MPDAIIIGAGVAGLAAAVELAAAGRHVRLIEAAGQAGGRCRSFHDERLGTVIDNGNHLMLSGNGSIRRFVDMVGSGGSLYEWSKPSFSFIEADTGKRWQLTLDEGRWPGWLIDTTRRVPDTRLSEYLSLLRVAIASRNSRLCDILNRDNRLYERFWEPLGLAVLNTEIENASANLLGKVLRETFLKGGQYSRPILSITGLSETFANPALRFLEAREARIDFSTRVTALHFDDDRVSEITTAGEPVSVTPDCPVVLAVPPGQASALVPGLVSPDQYRPIVNVHFRLPTTGEDSEPAIVGVIGGTAQWVFRRGAVASVTISAASDIVSRENARIADDAWPDVCAALALRDDAPPSHRVIKERRATIAQTPEMSSRRPGPRTGWRNLWLAGDWTDTGLPATIEGAIRSGQRAAKLALAG